MTETYQISGPKKNALENPVVGTRADEVHGSTSKSLALLSMNSNPDRSKCIRKRKRQDTEDDVEGRYLDQLVQEEAGSQQEHSSLGLRKKRQEARASEGLHSSKASLDLDKVDESEDLEMATSDRDEKAGIDAPQHESILARDLDLEKSLRTVFLANVSTLAITSRPAKKILLEHLSSFIKSLPNQDQKHGIESLRFRSVAFASNVIPKKAAFAKKNLMDSTTRSTNAYAVYTTQSAAREASKSLNGSVVLERHLRVDSVAHPAKVEYRKCVFVGNLGFVDDMNGIDVTEDGDSNKAPRNAKDPADVEEGLWRQFSKIGAVDSVRVVRDKRTRVGKGFAYVQFKDENAIEKALLFDGKKFPPMLPRILRVTRAKNPRKAVGPKENRTSFRPTYKSTERHSSPIPGHIRSLHGRASKLLGYAGAAQMKAAGENSRRLSSKPTITKHAESIVFEGHRASKPQGKGTLRVGGPGRIHGKPRTRSSRRGAEFKAKGGKKRTRS